MKKSIVGLLLLLVFVLARQWQMQAEIDRLQKSQIQFEQQMTEFMTHTNGSVESLTVAVNKHSAAIKSQAGSITMLGEAIQSDTRSIRILAGIK